MAQSVQFSKIAKKLNIDLCQFFPHRLVNLQVQIFLRDSWLNTLRTAIRSSLLDVGKGWFNMEERNWEVYQISKLAKFMQLVKFAMQVERSNV